MLLYHGSNTDIKEINLAMCRPYKDFGQGFYLTVMKEQAEKMAKRVARQCGKEEIHVQVNNGNTKRVPSRMGEENTEDILQRLADFLSDVIARHIDELDMKSLPSYESLKAADSISELYRRFHILRNDSFMINSSLIEPEDYTVFAENDRILLQKVS